MRWMEDSMWRAMPLEGSMVVQIGGRLEVHDVQVEQVYGLRTMGVQWSKIVGVVGSVVAPWSAKIDGVV